MKKIILITIITLVNLSAAVTCSALSPEEQENKKLTFFMVHFEVGAGKKPWNRTIAQNADVRNLKYQAALWPTAVRLVDLANKYTAKLTLSFNPQWAEYILKDNEKVKLIKQWQSSGHEISFHYHSFDHEDWCGFSNLTESKNDPRYRGTLEEGLEFVKELAKPEQLVTGASLQINVGGGKNNPDDARQKPSVIKKHGKTVLCLSHGRLMVNGAPPNWQPISLITEFKNEYAKLGPDEVFGVVIHCQDFYYDPSVAEEWFKFIQEQGDRIQTVKDIARELGFI